MHLIKFLDMKKIILFSFIIFFISCGKENSNSSWSFTRVFVTEKTIKNVTINDKKFIFETANNDKIECFLSYFNESNNKTIDDETLRFIIKESNSIIKSQLLLPSSFKPIEYNLTQYEDEYGKQKLARIYIKVSAESENRDRKVELYPWKIQYNINEKEFHLLN